MIRPTTQQEFDLQREVVFDYSRKCKKAALRIDAIHLIAQILVAIAITRYQQNWGVMYIAFAIIQQGLRFLKPSPFSYITEGVGHVIDIITMGIVLTYTLWFQIPSLAASVTLAYVSCMALKLSQLAKRQDAETAAMVANSFDEMWKNSVVLKDDKRITF